MTEDTNMILEELAKLYKEMTDEFKAVRSELQHLNDDLSNKIDDLQQVTVRNCYELTLLKANLTYKTEG